MGRKRDLIPPPADHSRRSIDLPHMPAAEVLARVRHVLHKRPGLLQTGGLFKLRRRMQIEYPDWWISPAHLSQAYADVRAEVVGGLPVDALITLSHAVRQRKDLRVAVRASKIVLDKLEASPVRDLSSVYDDELGEWAEPAPMTQQQREVAALMESYEAGEAD